MAMVTLIRNAKVYQPEYAGVKDILIFLSYLVFFLVLPNRMFLYNHL